MKKKVVIFFLILVISISFSNAIKTITVNETELVALKLEAIDADSDNLAYTFTKPLDENGKWQTSYGDAGEYNVVVTVSDGKSNTSENVLIVVNKKNAEPSIDSFLPEEKDITTDEGNKIRMEIKASDPNKDKLVYNWYLDNDEVSKEDAYVYGPDYGDAGVHRIKAEVSDGEKKSEIDWVIRVNKVDRARLLDEIKDIAADEGDVVRLELPDFEKYSLRYTISAPLGDGNEWQTGYGDSGDYDVEVKVYDRGFSANKTIKLTIRDKDRAPVFKPISYVWAKENQKVTIEIEASDPDNDAIEFSADSLPDGALLSGNRFEWTIGYNAVGKEDLLNGVLDKFHILYKPFKITFTAKSKGIEEKQSAWIMVKDVNRAPVLKDISPISVNEGEEIVITPEAEDPDGDKVSYSYEGWMNIDKYMTKYGDAGTYKVKVIASDGFLSDEKYATISVNKVNRAPLFGDAGKVEIRENQRLELKLNVNDPEGDAFEISARELPANSEIKEGVFVWVPDYDVLEAGYAVFTINFEASDGESRSTKDINITLHNANRAPKITEAAPANGIITGVNNKTIFAVKAEDPDGDELSYVWKFSLFDSHPDGEAISRIFTVPGEKTIKVVVSDGKDETEHEWDVKVTGKAKTAAVQKPKAAAKTIVKPVQPKPAAEKPKAQKPIAVQKPAVQKTVQPVVKQQAVQQPKTRTGSIYDQYTITYIEGDGEEVVGEEKESIIVWSS